MLGQAPAFDPNASEADQAHAIAQMAVNNAVDLENKVDAAMDRMDNLTGDDLMQIRKNRIAELKRKQEMMHEWKRKGHGNYEEISDQHAFFEESKTNKRVVCHFYRPTTAHCLVVDKHLEILAKKHMETRFIKLNAEKSPFLANKLQIVIMPTIACMVDNKTHDMIEGFDELGGTDQFKTKTLEQRLAKRGVIDYEGDMEARVKQKKSTKFGKGSIYGSTRVIYSSDEEDDDY